MSLQAKIQREIQQHEKLINELEERHRERMRRARIELANLKRLLGMAEGIEQ